MIDFFGSPEPPETSDKVGIPAARVTLEIRIIFCQHWYDNDTVDSAFKSFDNGGDEIIFEQVSCITNKFRIHFSVPSGDLERDDKKGIDRKFVVNVNCLYCQFEIIGTYHFWHVLATI